MHHLEALLKSGFPGLPEIKRKSATIVELSNGVYLRAFSTNPASLRGFFGDVILDEYAAAPHQDAIWAAAFACASPTLRNPDGYRIRVVGTPLGDSNRFWRICKGDLKEAWSVHSVSIHDAIADGFPLRQKDGKPGTIDDLRLEVGDADTFAQEFECSFLSSSARYISEALYSAAHFDGVTLPAHAVLSGAGMDVARTGHKSSIAELHKDTAGALWLLNEGLRSERGMPWPAQEAWASEVVQRCGTLAVDTTGIGTQFGERLVEEHGSSIIPVKFDTASKDMLFSGLRLGFERKAPNGKPMLRVPLDNPHLRRAVLSLRKRYSNAGHSVYDLDESAAGHGDEAVALALAVHACGGQVRSQVAMTESPVATVQRSEQAKFTRPKRGAVFG